MKGEFCACSAVHCSVLKRHGDFARLTQQQHGQPTFTVLVCVCTGNCFNLPALVIVKLLKVNILVLCASGNKCGVVGSAANTLSITAMSVYCAAMQTNVILTKHAIMPPNRKLERNASTVKENIKMTFRLCIFGFGEN